ncbi:MAG: response regulator [Candidatus Schekmanbacteria bacterium]|nr:MAG: response regulator [Candidatus Schekmanbacteria bacterium]
MGKKAFTTHEAAEYCNVSPATIIRWIESGLLKSTKTAGGHRRIPKEELIRFWKEINSDKDDENLRVLVIDDERFIVDFFKESIEKIDPNIKVQGAYSGFEAGELVHLFKPHIVFLDLVMKGIDGFQVCKRLKESPETNGIKIVAITGYPSKHNIDKIKEYGAVEVLEKPIKMIDIRRILIDLLSPTQLWK